MLELAANGYGNDEIAAMRGIVVTTVKNHFTNIFRKLDVRCRAHAIYRAVSMSLIPPEDPGR